MTRARAASPLLRTWLGALSALLEGTLHTRGRDPLVGGDDDGAGDRSLRWLRRECRGLEEEQRGDEHAQFYCAPGTGDCSFSSSAAHTSTPRRPPMHIAERNVYVIGPDGWKEPKPYLPIVPKP